MIPIILHDFNHEVGLNCESNTMRDMLAYHGIKLSEPMIIGLCEGYSFVYLNLKAMGFPFVGGRTKDGWLEKFGENTGIKFDIQKTTSTKKAWANLLDPLDQEEPVGLGVDFYHLDYIPEAERIHFVGHVITACGYDDDYVYVAERDRPEIQKLSHASLEKARAGKVMGMGGADNLSFTITEAPEFDLAGILPDAIKRMGQAFMDPPFKGAGYQGIYKLAREIKNTWPQIAREDEFKGSKFKGWGYVAAMWDDWGSGGSIFRQPLRDFLQEAQTYVDQPAVIEAGAIYREVAARYQKMTALLRRMDEDRSGEDKALMELAQMAELQAKREEKAMRMLAEL
ncbi:MAG: BtrH N-terminal domain-containing protein [Bacillota bacterium]